MRLQVSSSPMLISAEQTNALKVQNAGSTLYYKQTADVSSSSNDGSIASGASLVFTTPRWVITASGSTTVIDTVDVDGFGFEFTQPGAPISNEAISYLSTIAGTTGALSGTSLSVTGAVNSQSVTTGALVASTGTFSGLLSANAGVDVATALSASIPAYRSRQSATNRILANKLLGSDSKSAFDIYGDGKMYWGPGGSTDVDVYLYRSSANLLVVGGGFSVLGQLAVTNTTATNNGANSNSIIAPQQAISLQVGSGADCTALTADQHNACIRFLGYGVGHTHIAFFPTGSPNTQTAKGETRFERGGILTGTPNVKVGVGALYVHDNSATQGIQFGGDVNLYRSAANVLTTDDNFVALSCGARPANTTDAALGFTSVSVGDAWQRFHVSGAGKLCLGDGTATPSCNLYQWSADTLKTDDTFHALAVHSRPPAANDNNVAVGLFVTGETHYRWWVSQAGTINLGSGSIQSDVNLYRSAANQLCTDDALVVKGVLSPQAPDGAIQINKLASVGMTAIHVGVTGEAGNRCVVDAYGSIYMGDGSASLGDCRLYRLAANTFYTADQFVAADGLTTKVVAGAVSDGSFTATPASGTIGIDTTNSKIYVRVGSTWKSVTVA